MTDFKIKPELLDEWKNVVGENSCDPYSFGVVMATVNSFKVLDNPKSTPKEAEEAWKGLGLSGFMAGSAASWIAYFHERGEEFNTFWNKQFGVENKKGTVNPAILTINN